MGFVKGKRLVPYANPSFWPNDLQSAVDALPHGVIVERAVGIPDEH